MRPARLMGGNIIMPNHIAHINIISAEPASPKKLFTLSSTPTYAKRSQQSAARQQKLAQIKRSSFKPFKERLLSGKIFPC